MSAPRWPLPSGRVIDSEIKISVLFELRDDRLAKTERCQWPSALLPMVAKQCMEGVSPSRGDELCELEPSARPIARFDSSAFAMPPGSACQLSMTVSGAPTVSNRHGASGPPDGGGTRRAFECLTVRFRARGGLPWAARRTVRRMLGHGDAVCDSERSRPRPRARVSRRRQAGRILL